MPWGILFGQQNSIQFPRRWARSPPLPTRRGLLVLMATSTGQWRAASQSLGSCQLHLVMPWCGKETHPSLPTFQHWALKHMMVRRTETNVSIAGIGPWQCSDLWLPPALSVIDRLARNVEWDTSKLMSQPQSRLDITGSSNPWVSAVTLLPKQPGKEMMCMVQGSRWFSIYIFLYIQHQWGSKNRVSPIKIP